MQYVLQKPDYYSKTNIPNTKLLTKISHAAEANIGTNELLS